MGLRNIHLLATAHVLYPVEDVWAWVSDPFHSPLWDKSVAAIETDTPGSAGVGWVGTTTAPSGMRQQFRIVEWKPSTCFAFELLESSYFRAAQLSFRFDAEEGGTRIVHEFELELRSLLLSPVIRLTQRRALAADMAALSAAVNRHLSPSAI
jgi:hypothetical protein